MACIEYNDVAHARRVYEIDSSIAVSACNDGWKVGDQNGSGVVTWIEIEFNSAESYWTLTFSDSSKLYVNGN